MAALVLISGHKRREEAEKNRGFGKKGKESKKSHDEGTAADKNPKEKPMKYETPRMQQPSVISVLIWPDPRHFDKSSLFLH